MGRKLTILVNCYSTVGPITALSGVTRALLARGHRVIFLIDNFNLCGKLAEQGFEEYICQNTCGYKKEWQEVDGNGKAKNPGEETARQLIAAGVFGAEPPLKKLQKTLNLFVENKDFNEYVRKLDIDVKKAIETIKPDVLLVDNLLLLPSIYYSGLPWIQQVSSNPCCRLFDSTLPPGGSGYPSDGNFDMDIWMKHKEVLNGFFYSKQFNDMLEKAGYARYPDDTRMPPTQLFTIMAFPEELNYPQLKNRSDIFNLELFNQVPPNENTKLADLVPAAFLDDDLEGQFSGKIIYLGMGSMTSTDVQLMKRLVGMLATTKHKYIVSKGHAHAEYDLPRNMWGERFLPQRKLLPHVDLVIHHGGNNTLTEAFALGKVALVLPTFWDQFDNAQRIHETKYGLRLDPYTCTQNELVSAVEELLADEELAARMQQAAARLQASTAHERLCKKIEGLLNCVPIKEEDRN